MRIECDGELGRVGGDPDADPALVGGHVVDAVGHHLAELLVLEVVHLHAPRIALGTIVASAVLVVADQLLLLGVDGDDRLARRLRREHLGVDVLELGVAVGMPGAFVRLAVGLAREAELDEQLAHAVGADRMAHVAQRRRQLVHALRHPQQRPHRIAPRRRLDEALEVGKQAWIALGHRLAAATLAPHPASASGGASRSSWPRSIVERASPVIRDTTASPPQPAARTSLAANTRRPRSSRFEPSASHRCPIAPWSIMRPTYACSLPGGIPAPESLRRTTTDRDSVIVRSVLRQTEAVAQRRPVEGGSPTASTCSDSRPNAAGANRPRAPVWSPEKSSYRCGGIVMERVVVVGPMDTVSMVDDLPPKGFEIVKALHNPPEMRAALPGTDYLVGFVQQYVTPQLSSRTRPSSSSYSC